jgi:hypothetical protein
MIENPAKRLSPKRMSQVGLPPGVIGLRWLFEDKCILASMQNPAKWEDPINSIGISDGYLGGHRGFANFWAGVTGVEG